MTAALIAVGVLIYYVHNVAVSMQVTAITERIAGELERAIDRLFPEPLGESPDPPAPEPIHLRTMRRRFRHPPADTCRRSTRSGSCAGP